MPGLITKTISIVDHAFSPDKDHREILSIEISPSGFSYAILDAAKCRYLVLEHFEPEKGVKVNIQDYDLLLAFLSGQHWVGRSYERVYMGWFSPHLVLLPNEVASYDDQKSLLEFSCNIPDKHTVKSDRLNNMNGFGVYSFPNWIPSLLESFFPFNRLRHSGSICLESMLTMQQTLKEQPDVILYLRESFFDILLLDKSQLVFYQIFPFQHFDDILYLLFYVMKQFGRNAPQMHMMLAGDIQSDSEQSKRLANYFEKVSFVQRNNHYNYCPAFDSIPHHGFYTLLNMGSCG